MLWLVVSTVELRVTVAEYEEEDELDSLVETGTLEEEPCDVMLELKVELMLDTVSVVEVIDEVEFRTFVVVVMNVVELVFLVVDMNDVVPTTLVTGVLE